MSRTRRFYPAFASGGQGLRPYDPDQASGDPGGSGMTGPGLRSWFYWPR